MKVLLPITTEQTISIIPRNLDVSGGAIDIEITKDGEKIAEQLIAVPVENGNHVDVSFSSTILEEGYSYFVEMTYAGELYYRDKFYITNQTDFTAKHKQSQNKYKEYNVLDDNTYIIK